MSILHTTMQEQRSTNEQRREELEALPKELLEMKAGR